MSNFHDFLVEHAMFPFPELVGTRSINSTDISPFDVGLINAEWKAKHAVRDNSLNQKLCSVLQDILGDQVLPAATENFLLPAFSPKLGLVEVPGMPGVPDRDWLKNPSEIRVSLPKESSNRASADSTDRLGRC